MKTLVKIGLALVVIVVMFLLCSVQVKAQSLLDPNYVFTWTQNLNGSGNTVLTTPTVTNTQPATTAIDLFTSYHIEYTISGGILNINRQNILPNGPNDGTVYNAGPMAIEQNGSVVNFSAWLNSGAQAGSSESIYNIYVNRMPLSQTITADFANPSVQFQYTSTNQITSIMLDYSINVVNNVGETGIALSLTPTIVPEPTTLSLLIISAIGVVIVTKRKKLL